MAWNLPRPVRFISRIPKELLRDSVIGHSKLICNGLMSHARLPKLVHSLPGIFRHMSMIALLGSSYNLSFGLDWVYGILIVFSGKNYSWPTSSVMKYYLCWDKIASVWGNSPQKIKRFFFVSMPSYDPTLCSLKLKVDFVEPLIFI